MWWHLVAGLAAGLALVYLVLLGLLWGYARRHPDTVSMRDALRLLPDVLRLLHRLAADRSLPRGVRIRLLLLIAYLVSPLDLDPRLRARRRSGR